MHEVITVTFEGGVLRPDKPLAFSPGTKVRMFVEAVELAAPTPDALAELDQLCTEFPIDSGGALLTRDQLHERR